MLKKILFLSLYFSLGYVSASKAQQNKQVDSLIKAQNILFHNRDTVTVPLMVENPTLLSQNYIYKLRLDSIVKTIDLPYNEYVQNYIDIYAKRKDMIGQMLGLSNYYFPIFEKALKDYNLPQEIKYLPVIESAMNPHAVSRVGATGLWQFMFGTGKAYGLKMDNFVDERKDPVQASYAAAAYFRDAYEELGDWLLAIAAYNCGKGNVTRAMNKAGSRDFWEIRPFLPQETRNYVPAFIAAIYIMNYSAKHQITAKNCNLFLKTDTVLVNRFVSLPQLAEALNIEEKSLMDVNPSYKKKIVNGSDDFPKRIVMPRMAGTDYTAVYEVLNNSDLGLNQQIIQASTDDARELRKKTGATILSKSTVYHKVKPQQSLIQIANIYGVELQDLKVWNNLKSKTIVPGQQLKVYVKSKTSIKPAANYVHYKVKLGDTLSDIAERFNGATAQSIKRDNKLANANLKPGMVLKISKG